MPPTQSSVLSPQSSILPPSPSPADHCAARAATRVLLLQPREELTLVISFVPAVVAALLELVVVDIGISLGFDALDHLARPADGDDEVAAIVQRPDRHTLELR